MNYDGKLRDNYLADNKLFPGGGNPLNIKIYYFLA